MTALTIDYRFASKRGEVCGKEFLNVMESFDIARCQVSQHRRGLSSGSERENWRIQGE